VTAPAKAITTAADVADGAHVLMAVLRVDATRAATRKLIYAELDLARARAFPAGWGSPGGFAKVEAALAKRTETAAKDLEEATARSGLWDRTLSADELRRATRGVVLEAVAAKRAAQMAVEHELTGEAKRLWDALHKDPAHRAILEELGPSDFENLLEHTHVKGTGWTSIKGRLFELITDRTAAWADQVLKAGDRAATAIALLPEPASWSFHYSRDGIKALAFADPRRAAIPAKLLERIPTKASAEDVKRAIEAAGKDVQFSEVSSRLLEAVDKSAWLRRDFGDWQIALPLLFGESKGLHNFRDLVKQLPKDVERAGLLVAEIDGKPTVMLLAPSISRPTLVAIGPRELSAGQAAKIAGAGAEVKSVKLDVSNDRANAFAKRLEKLLTPIR
jgi:hypothetical protein